MQVRFRLAAALTSTAVIAASLLGIVVTAAPADAWSSANLQLIGRGDGDGIGLGQDGAFGYATQYLWSANQILTHYYGGSVRAVGLAPMTVDLVWQGVDALQVGSPGAAFRIDNVTVPAGAAAKLSYSATTGYAVQIAPAGCAGSYGAARHVRSNTFVSTVANPTTIEQMLHLCGDFAYRGTLAMVPGRTSRFDKPFRVVNQLSMNDYLRSVLANVAAGRNRQIDAGGNEQFLRAMAITLRSLAATTRKRPWAKTDTFDMSLPYEAAGNWSGGSLEDPRTDEAVQATGSQVVVNAQGTAVTHTVYCGSSGGWTAGGGFPVVQDAGDAGSPANSWRQVIDVGYLSRQLEIDIGTLRAVGFTRTGLGDLGGRVRTVTLQGDRGSATMTAAFFTARMGLRSDWFAVNTAPPGFHLSNGFNSPAINYEGAFGQPGDQPFACDFDGDGKDTVGVYRARTGTFYIRNSLVAGTPYYTVRLGTAGDIGVCGDWNGDGIDTVGVYDPRTARFYLINTVGRTASTPLIQVLLGGRSFQPLAGDWDGDHHATLGVWDPVHHYVYLVNSLTPGAPRSRYQFGFDGDPVFAGDFDGDGRDGYGQYLAGMFHVVTTPGGFDGRNSDDLGQSGDVPLVGDWDGDGVDSIGYGSSY
jgi:peptidoglycan hydrolase-like amidase